MSYKQVRLSTDESVLQACKSNPNDGSGKKNLCVVSGRVKRLLGHSLGRFTDQTWLLQFEFKARSLGHDSFYEC
jgi:hypothetical protein